MRVGEALNVCEALNACEASESGWRLLHLCNTGLDQPNSPHL